MIYIENNNTNPYFNFALEYYFLTEKELQDDNIFMFWRTNPTLMIGKFQNTIEEINQSYADKNNINVVRRISGGGTIYTDLNTWQYSVINKNYKSNKVNFEIFTKPIIEALKTLNVDAYLNNRNDLLIANKKFSGNAQCIKDNYILHHGSILFNTNIEEMVKSITIDESKIISKGIKSVRDRVTNVSEHLDIKIDNLEFKEIMLKFLLKYTDSVYTLTNEDIKRIEEIQKEKFENWEWNYGNSPKFNIKKGKRFSGGKLEFSIDVNKGIIKKIKINGDFFSNSDIYLFEEKLIGCKYDKYEINKVLQKIEIDKYIHNITKEEVLECII